MGHVRDLPGDAKSIPAKYKAFEWARLGVNVDNDFEPLYVVSPDKKAVVRDLKAAVQDVDELLLATDEDREGESISWHLLAAARARRPGPPDGVPRDHPRGHRRGARQSARHRRPAGARPGNPAHPRPAGRLHPLAAALEEDRLRAVGGAGAVGRHAAPGGARARAPRLPVRGVLGPAGPPRARRPAVRGRAGAARRGRSSPPGRTSTSSPAASSRDATWWCSASPRRPRWRGRVAKGAWRVSATEEKPGIRRPAPPFTTSTLQQEANRKLRLSARDAMRAAQGLYERGFITYMRTDSVNLSEQAITAARTAVTELYGTDYLPDAPRRYATKSANAQEAHEAIRPAGATFRHPEVHRPRRPRPGALRAHLEADHGLADGRRAADLDVGHARGRRRHLPRHRQADRLPRLPPRLRGRERRSRGRAGGPRGHPAAPRGGRHAQVRRRGAGPPRDPAARALHRGHAGQGARGRRRRPAQHLRLDHRDDPRARLCGAPGPGAGADLHRVRRHRHPRGALPPPGGREVHRRHGGGAGRDFRGEGGVAAVPAGVLPRPRRAAAAGAAAREADRPHRRAHPPARRARRQGQDRQVRPLRGDRRQGTRTPRLAAEGRGAGRPEPGAGGGDPPPEGGGTRLARRPPRDPARRSSS